LSLWRGCVGLGTGRRHGCGGRAGMGFRVPAPRVGAGSRSSRRVERKDHRGDSIELRQTSALEPEVADHTVAWRVAFRDLQHLPRTWSLVMPSHDSRYPSLHTMASSVMSCAGTTPAQLTARVPGGVTGGAQWHVGRWARTDGLELLAQRIGAQVHRASQALAGGHDDDALRMRTGAHGVRGTPSRVRRRAHNGTFAMAACRHSSRPPLRADRLPVPYSSRTMPRSDTACFTALMVCSIVRGRWEGGWGGGLDRMTRLLTHPHTHT
jgi:hypothetical protein